MAREGPFPVKIYKWVIYGGIKHYKYLHEMSDHVVYYQGSVDKNFLCMHKTEHEKRMIEKSSS